MAFGAGGGGGGGVEVAELLEDEGEELLDVAPLVGSLAELDGLGDRDVVVGVEVGELRIAEAAGYCEGGDCSA